MCVPSLGKKARGLLLVEEKEEREDKSVLVV
jgi:hypothetical protein